MLDGLNALIQCFKFLWEAFFHAPLYGDLTWGYFLIACAIMNIFIIYFIGRFK